MSGFVFTLILTFGIIGVAAGLAQSKKTNEAWARVAKRLQLVFQPGQLFSRPRLSGIHRGCSVLVTTFSKGSGKHRSTYTRFRVSYKHSLDLGLRLTRQSMLSGIGKLFGSQDIEVGDQEFDDAVVVKGRDPERVKQFLTPSRRLRAARFLTTYQGAVIDDLRIEWDRSNVERDPERLVRTIERMTSLANHMTDDRSDDAEVDRVIEARQEGLLDEALSMLQEMSPDDDSDAAELHIFEGQILLATGQSRAAAETFSKAYSEDPDDDEALKLAEHSARISQASVAAPPEEMPPPATTVAEPTGQLNVDALAESLFAPTKMSSETNELFEEQYRNQHVRWTGTLKNVRTFTFDLVFGSEPGLRAVFEICRVGEGSFGGRAVQAVVQLPADLEETMRSKIDTELEFEGTLIGCDAFMRNLFVGAARIV